MSRGTTDGSLVFGTIIRPKLSLQPILFGWACYAKWQGGDFTKKTGHRANPPFAMRSRPFDHIIDMWLILGREPTDGSLVVGTIIRPELSLQPILFGEACYASGQGGIFTEDAPQGNEPFCPAMQDPHDQH